MKRVTLLLLLLATGLFLVMVSNVVLGAFGATTFLQDIEEMLLLFAAVAVFVIAILLKERQAIGKRQIDK